MDTTLSIALSHQVARRRQMDIIANNIANMGTTGFKRENVMFGQYLREAEGDQPKSVRQISYVQDYGITRNMSDGPLISTGNKLDIALQGDGLLQVRRQNGDIAYTRNGHMSLSPDFNLVTSTGENILDTAGNAIQIPPTATDIKIATDGTISSPSVGQIAKLGVVTIADKTQLKKIGDNLFSSELPPTPATDFNIVQGMIESSNVQPVLEITRMISVSRAYISTSKIMEKLADAQLKAINTLAKVS